MPFTTPEPDEPVFRALAKSIHAGFSPLIRRDWRGQEKVPRTGGVLLVANHLTNLDPLLLGEYLVDAGRWPRYLGKQELWRVPPIGWLGRHCHQIPIERSRAGAGAGLQMAVDAVRAGEAVVIYPEATRGADPDGWPMVARSGAARVALAARCPVVPLGQVGADVVLPAHGFHPHVWPPTTISIACGDPVDLSDLYDAFYPDAAPASDDVVEPDAATTRSHEAIVEAGARMIDAITALVAEIRREPAPPDHYDKRLGQRVSRPTPPAWLG